jgi:peptide/nickel transport system substrate-binding protein
MDITRLPTNRSHAGLSASAAATRMPRRRLLQGAAALGMSAPIAGPVRSARAQTDPKTLVVGLGASPSDLDPHSQYDYRSLVPVRGAYQGLIVLKESFTDQYEGLLAESWESNEDQSVWTFHLREGITFHDGTPCDAEAVRASYERLLTMQKGAWYVVGRFVSDPAQITAPDPRTVVFDLGKPQPLFEAAMGGTYGVQVVNVKVAMEHEEEGDFGNTWMMTFPEGTGTGPYRIVEFEPGQQAILERYDGYWGGWEGEHFDRVIVRVVEEPQTLRQLLESGEVDITDRFSLPAETVAELASNPELRVDRQTSTEVVYYTMTESGPLASPEARQAMCYAFPYEEVLQGVYAGFAQQARGAVAEKTRGFDASTFQYTTDLERARELVAAAGIEGQSLRVLHTISANNNAIAELFGANLAEIGVELEIESVDATAFTATFYGDMPVEERPQFMLWSWWPDYNDAWNHLEPQVACEPHGSANAGFYCNERVDELLAQTRDAVDEETYQAAMTELQQILAETDPSAIYFAQPEFTTTMRADIQGFFFNPINTGTYEFHKLSRAAS